MIRARAPYSLLLIVLMSGPAVAQDVRSVELPNPMTVHTWFIIGAVGAFLAWSISYTIQLQKEAQLRKKDRGDLLQEKEGILDKIAELEARKESGAITDQRHKRELKELRFRLRKILEKSANAETQKSAKKTS